MSTLQELQAQARQIAEQIAKAKETAKAEKAEHLQAITDALAIATEGLTDSVRYFGGKVPILLVATEDGKVNVEGRFTSPDSGQILATGVRHGRARIDGKEYSSLNAGMAILYPDAGKKGTEAWRAWAVKRGNVVEFVPDA